MMAFLTPLCTPPMAGPVSLVSKQLDEFSCLIIKELLVLRNSAALLSSFNFFFLFDCLGNLG